MQPRVNKFAKDNRIVSKEDFKKVFNGRRIKLRFVKISFAGNNRSSARLGISIRKSAGLNSVMRNSVKRITREAFRCNKLDLSGLDLVFLVERYTEKRELKKEIEYGLNSIKKNIIAN